VRPTGTRILLAYRCWNVLTADAVLAVKTLPEPPEMPDLPRAVWSASTSEPLDPTVRSVVKLWHHGATAVPVAGVPPLSVVCTFAIVVLSAPNEERSETIA